MNLGKKTKIVCTIGPATENVEKMTDLVNAGMNVIRLNFSHDTWEKHQQRADNIRNVMKKTGQIVAIMQDLSGPKIRIGTFKDNTIVLREGQEFVLTTDQVEGTAEKVNINYPNLPKEVKAGSYIMLQDGTKKLQVVEVRGNDIVTKVVVGGKLSSHRGVNVPGAGLSLGSLTEKDKKDVEFGVKNNVDFVALSFVRKGSDIKELRTILNNAGSKAQIIAKIETPEALKNINEIIELSDGIMIARGDLAIEIPAEEVPLVQKLIINKCNAIGKPVITATQMLESMVKNSVPTRAEVSDIANAIIDGSDAIMLSEETALGEYPVEAVKVMARIALRIEKEVYARDIIAEYAEPQSTTDIVSRSAVHAAHDLKAKLIVAFTRSGRTARMIAKYRPSECILVMTDVPENASKLVLSFGCYPVIVPTFTIADEVVGIARNAVSKLGLCQAGDKIVITAGLPFGKAKETNFVMVETV